MITSEIVKMPNEQEWNELREKSRFDDAFQSLEWAEIESRCFSNEAVFLETRSDERLVGGNMFIKRKCGPVRILTGRGGPLFLSGHESVVVRSILSYLKSVKKPLDLSYLSFRPDYKAKEKWPGHHTTKATFILDTSVELKTIWERVDQRARRGVRKAEKNGVTIVDSADKEDWMWFAKFNEEHAKTKGYTPYPKRFYEMLFDIAKHRLAKLYVAKVNDETVAGALFLKSNNHVVYHSAACLPDALKLSPNDLIFWKAIEHATEDGIKVFDFGGADINPKLSGIYDFKKKWSGTYTEYPVYTLSVLHSPLRKLTKIIPSLKKLWYT